jgi:hypothetical protein
MFFGCFQDLQRFAGTAKLEQKPGAPASSIGA